MSIELRDISDGPLVVRTTRDAEGYRVSLCGELDLANAATAEAQLRKALEAGDAPVVIDMSELEFIDSTGIALLVATLAPNGHAAELRFVPSNSPPVTRVLELTGLAERLPLVEPV
jgi:anti-sigma B factor antagonist